MTEPFQSSGNTSLFQTDLINLWISKRIVLPSALIKCAGIWSKPGNLCHFIFSIFISTSNALGTLAVCKQITFLVLYHIRSRLVTLLKATDAPIKFSAVLILLLVLSSSVSAFDILSFPLNVYWLHVLQCFSFLHCFGLYSLTTAI